MTNRFSPEYISYILSDEAKVLQEQLPREGEGIWFIERSEDFLGPNEWDEWSKPHVLDEEGRAYIKDYERYEDMEFIVVPTLTDLLGMIEERWPYVDMNTYPQGWWLDDATMAHIMASAECVEWDPEGCGFWRCKECGDTLHDQPDGSQTYGPYPDIIDEVRDEIWEAWDGGANLPICPHCGEAREKGLLLAAATLAVRVLEEGKE